MNDSGIQTDGFGQWRLKPPYGDERDTISFRGEGSATVWTETENAEARSCRNRAETCHAPTGGNTDHAARRSQGKNV